MKKLKESLNFRGFPEKNEIMYYDGEDKVLEVEDFHAIWTLLETYRGQNEELQKERRKKWKKEFSISNEECEVLCSFLEEYGFLYEEPPTSTHVNRMNSRNFNYFNIYDPSLESRTILDQIENLHIVIIGVGTIGATLVLTLAKLGIKNISIIDPDYVEEKNIRAQVLFDYEDVNEYKVNVIKDKLASIEPECVINGYSQRITNIDDLLKLNLEPFHFIFGCFDESSETLHNAIASHANDLSSKYIVLGYFNDSTIANDLTSQQGLHTLHESYKSATPYYISENRGTIIQSFIGSILISKILVDHLLDNRTSSNLSFNLSDLNTTSLFNKTQSTYSNDFMFHLSQLMPLDEQEIRNKMNYLKSIIESINEIPNHVELEVLSMYQIFDLLLNLGAIEEYNLEPVYQEFLELVNRLDNEEQDSTVYYSEELYNNYLNLVKNIKIPDLANSHIYEVLNNLNTVKDYNERLELQQMSHDSMVEQGEQLLDFFNKVKKNYQKVSLNSYYTETLGVESETVFLFKELIEDHQGDLITLFGKTLFPSCEDNMTLIDYLYEIPSGTNSFVKDLDASKELLINSLTAHFNNPFMVEHVEKMFTGAHIKVIEDPNHHGINRTYYFPHTKDNKIILSHKGTLEDFFILCHELGHAYYNNMYGQSYFEQSRQILNEALAYLFELQCLQSIIHNENLPDSIKSDIHTQYIHRVNKIVLSQFSIYQLEDTLIDFITEHNNLTLSDYLSIQRDLDKKLTPDNVTYINQEFTHMNALLNTSFVFGYRDHITDPIAYLLAFSLLTKYKGKENSLDLKVKSALENSHTGIEVFTKELLDTNETVHSLVRDGLKALHGFIAAETQSSI